MRSVFFILLLVCSLSGFGQDFQKEINEQVWKPFISTFSNLDAKLFLAVHSKDVVRSSRDAKQILTWSEYLEQQDKMNKRMAADGLSMTLDLHFTERIATSDRAIDVGIYKTTMTDKTGKSQSYYGRFHVVLRKENGVWKILVDTDSSEGDTIDEEDFNAAKPM
jgi:ketosteroid isomerase-like protein